MNFHCINTVISHRNSADRPQAFPQNFHTRILGEISAFYTVYCPLVCRFGPQTQGVFKREY